VRATDLVSLFHSAAREFGERVDAVAPEDWHRATPCEEWDVRTLVNHVVVEDLWAPPLFDGRTIEEVGDRFDGDQLGDDPAAAWRAAIARATEAVAAPGALERTVHLSFGETPAEEYVMQLLVDHAVHADDLAVAIGAGRGLDPALVDAIATWFDDREDLYRQAGVIGPAVEPTDPADARSRLVARFGRR
jgi:uncharacterized protein (TIGR03086 family)